MSWIIISRQESPEGRSALLSVNSGPKVSDPIMEFASRRNAEEFAERYSFSLKKFQIVEILL